MLVGAWETLPVHEKTLPARGPPWRRVGVHEAHWQIGRSFWRIVEAWMAVDLFGSGLGASDLLFGEECGACATPEWAEIAQIHRFGVETPLLVVLFGKTPPKTFFWRPQEGGSDIMLECSDTMLGWWGEEKSEKERKLTMYYIVLY
jgi:hypothetical protein